MEAIYLRLPTEMFIRKIVIYTKLLCSFEMKHFFQSVSSVHL